MARTGRPRIELDWTLIGNLAKISCTEEEIAASLDVDISTLNRDCKRRFKTTFAEFARKKAKAGDLSVKRAIFKRYIAPDCPPALQIFWLKNKAGWADKHEHNVTANVSATVEKKPNIRALSDEELRQYRKLMAKMEDEK